MLRGEVMEGEQLRLTAPQRRDRPRVLRVVLGRESLDGRFGLGARRCLHDRVQRSCARCCRHRNSVWKFARGRVVLHSRVEMDSPAKMYLVRVFVDVDRNPPEVVTVYRTSRISKYW